MGELETYGSVARSMRLVPRFGKDWDWRNECRHIEQRYAGPGRDVASARRFLFREAIAERVATTAANASWPRSNRIDRLLEVFFDSNRRIFFAEFFGRVWFCWAGWLNSVGLLTAGFDRENLTEPPTDGVL
jgi:hypothetical protein